MLPTYITAGDVILVDFPFVQGGGSKRRPAVVLSRDADRNPRFIIAPLTTKGKKQYADQLQIDPRDCPQSGLNKPGAMKCNELITIAESHVIRHLGTLSDGIFAKALRFTLGL